ncbi:hypothetical protein ACFL6S_30440 [Candidatus Poribacteria bacterium]
MKKPTTLLASIIMMFLAIYTVHSGELPVSADLKFYGTYIDNVFQNYLPESDYVTLTYLNTSYDVTPGTSIFYNANFSLFSEHPDLQNHTHYLGTDYERAIFQGKGRLYLGGKLGLRQNTSEYADYNRRSGNAYTTLKYYITKTTLAKIGYEIEYGSYPNLRTFNSLENHGFMQLSKSFQTRTTLQAMVAGGRREYTDMSDDSDRSYASQVTGSLKLAQSLADNTGLQLQYLWHHASQGVDEQYIEDAYYSAEEFFDDEYVYSGSEYRTVLKHMAPWRTTLKASLSMKDRDYNVPSIYTVSGSREDRDITFRFEVEKGFSLPLGAATDFTLHIQFLHRRNNSNDSYYDYSTNMLSIGTKAAF